MLAEDTIKKVNKQLTEWDKIFTNYICDKSHVSKIYKDFPKVSVHKKNQLNQEKYMDTQFFKNDIKMTNKHMKR